MKARVTRSGLAGLVLLAVMLLARPPTPPALASRQAAFGAPAALSTGDLWWTKSNFGWGVLHANDAALQMDGKLVLAGRYEPEYGETYGALLRYGPGGTPDPTFGDGGLATADFPSGYVITAVVLQPDGRIVSAGSVWQETAGGSDLLLMRHLSDGTLDPTFGERGRVTVGFGRSDDIAYSLLLQPDGRIVTAGEAWPAAGRRRLVLTRHLPDGTLDSTFGGDGRVDTALESGGATANSVLLQPDGKIVAAGNGGGPGSNDILLARYLPDGSLDSSFGSAGLVLTDIHESLDSAQDVLLQPDGGIVTAVYYSPPDSGDGDFALVRYLENGTLDTTFGEAGIALTNLGGRDDHARAVALQPDGKIVTAGQFVPPGGGDSDFALTRHLPDGTLDHSFGQEGRVITDFGESNDYATGLLLQPDGRIVTSGITSGYSYPSDLAITRHDATGAPDPTFGDDGRVTSEYGGHDGQAYAVAVQPDGRIVTAGHYDTTYGNVDFALMRHLPDGTLDLAFGDTGLVTADAGSRADVAYDVLLQPDGKIVTAGTAQFDSYPTYNSSLALTRHHANGAPDTAFGENGQVVENFGGWAAANSVLLQPDGKIVTAGFHSAGGSDGDFLLVRYNPDGTLDPTFGGDGWITTGFGATDDTAQSVILQPDGRLLAAGTGGDGNFALARYLPDGTLDSTFGNGGRVVHDLGGPDRAYALALQLDGKILAAGTAGDAALVRYQADGTVDASFGVGGLVTLAYGGYGTEARSVLVQPDGKIVIAGFSDSGRSSTVMLARYYRDGTPDPTFSRDGSSFASFSGGNDRAYDMQMLPDGRLVVAGVYAPFTDRDFLLALYRGYTPIGDGAVLYLPQVAR